MLDWLKRLWGVAQTNPLAVVVIGGLLTAAIIGIWVLFGRRVVSWFRQSILDPIQAHRTRVPARTLIVQPGGRAKILWADGKWGDKPITMVEIALHLTNVTDRPIQVSKALLYFRRGIFRDVREGEISIQAPGQDLYGGFPALPNRMSNAEALWTFYPAVRQKQGKLTVRVCVIDQFGNRCWSDKLRVPRAEAAERML